MSDSTESVRRQMARQINASPKCRADLEAEHGTGNVWDTRELARDFIVIGFSSPVVVVRRKSDGVTGSLFFQHMPRYYFDFKPDE